VEQSPAGKNMSTEAEDVVGSIYLSTTGEDRAIANCRVCGLAIAL
jgi:hypothetical protein